MPVRVRPPPALARRPASADFFCRPAIRPTAGDTKVLACSVYCNGMSWPNKLRAMKDICQTPLTNLDSSDHSYGEHKMQAKSTSTAIVRALASAGLLTLIALPGTALATTWDAAASFNNPGLATSSAWQYGVYAGNQLNGAFQAFDLNSPSYSINGGYKYFSPSGTGQTIGQNITGSVLYPSGTIYAAPGTLNVHPSSVGGYAVVRWTAEQAGAYDVAGGFYGISMAGARTSTDVHILKNGASLFDGLVEGHWANENFRVGPAGALHLQLSVGDTLDFAVGYGSNHSWGWDSTRVDAVITGNLAAPIPEPETYAMLLAGLGVLGFVGRRRRLHTALIR
jgi:hypothetical protein